MPPIEGTLASDLSAGVTSTLKACHPSQKKKKKTSCLNGKAYMAACQAGAALHDVCVAGIPG